MGGGSVFKFFFRALHTGVGWGSACMLQLSLVLIHTFCHLSEVPIERGVCKQTSAMLQKLCVVLETLIKTLMYLFVGCTHLMHTVALA